MRSMDFYDKLSDLNVALYGGAKDFEDFKLIDTYSDSTGVFIALYDIGNNETLFAIKGTDSLLDLVIDGLLWMRKATIQEKAAAKYYETIKDKYTTIIFTGYSLGASVAQLLCKRYGNETICFEPYGTGKAKGNCINFGNFWDIIFMQNPNEMVGDVYLIPMKMPKSGKRDITTHMPQQHGKPSSAKKITKQLETNLEYFKRISEPKFQEFKNTVKPYLKDGIIPTIQQKINGLKPIK